MHLFSLTVNVWTPIKVTFGGTTLQVYENNTLVGKFVTTLTFEGGMYFKVTPRTVGYSWDIVEVKITKGTVL